MSKHSGKGGVLLTVFLILFFALVYNSCADNSTSRDWVSKHLDTEIQMRILQDYFDRFFERHPNLHDSNVNDFSIIAYHGTFKELFVLRILYKYTYFIGMNSFDDVAGVRFLVNIPITLWKDGNFFTLQEAYDLGKLTPIDLRRIAYAANPIPLPTNF